MPYFCDSQVANEVSYRLDTPLQSNIEGGSIAQCILFGLFGIDVTFDGVITIKPVHTGLANELNIKGLKIRNKTIDVLVKGDNYEVVVDNKRVVKKVGTGTVIQ